MEPLPPGRIMGWCEDDAHDLDGDKQEVDLYMFRGATPAGDHFIWLCEAHRP